MTRYLSPARADPVRADVEVRGLTRACSDESGLLVIYAQREDHEPLRADVALGLLADLGPFTTDGTGKWWRYYGITTKAGDDAYATAFSERE